MESGGLEPDTATQSLNEGEITGLPYVPLETARLRYFGGTTNHWGGWCRPLDEIDFTARPWVPHSGWPLSRADLDPFYRRAQSLCQLGPFAYDAGAWEDQDTSPRLPFSGDRVMTNIWQIGPPTRFGASYRDVIARSDNVRAYLHASVVNIDTTPTAERVTRVRVGCLHGKRFSVSATLFIVAAGGIENPRLLLVSNTVQRDGLGNRHDLVGRFFMEHPQLWSGALLLSRPSFSMGLYAIRDVKRTRVVGCVSLAEKVQRREQLLNACAFLEPDSSGETPAPIGGVSQRSPSPSLRQADPPGDFETHLGQVIADLNHVTLRSGRAVRRSPPVKTFRLFARPEPAPNPNSRVTITAARDSLGMNRVQLHWELSPIDERSMRRSQEILGREVGRAGLGRVRSALEDEKGLWTKPEGAYHHIGTTRMHEDPKQGVVDAKGRVHGISNLYIAGSSVFPTAGYANPTLTIVALAVRLADHVKRLLR